MNDGQQKFMDFLLARVQDDKIDEAKAILEESFRKQDEGAFDPAYMAQVMPQLMALVKPEHIEELKQAAAHMRSTID